MTITVSAQLSGGFSNQAVGGELVNATGAPPVLAGSTTATFAVALGYSLVPPSDRSSTTVRRIWADNHLIYDVLNPAGVIINAATAPSYSGMSLTFHSGDPDAVPDPTIVNDMGKLAPAFRNMLYMVIHDFPLQVGATPLPPSPVIIAPVTTISTVIYPFPGLSTSGMPGAYYGGVGPIGGMLYMAGPPNPAYPEGGLLNGYWYKFASIGGFRSYGPQGQTDILTFPFRNFISADDAGNVTCEITTTKPGTTTQAPAPAPSYATAIPTIVVELVDATSITPAITAFTPLDDSAAKQIGAYHLMADWTTSTAYGFTDNYHFDSISSFVEHSYSIADRLELQRFAPVDQITVNVGSPTQTTYSGVTIFNQYVHAHDTVHGFAFFSAETTFSNSDPLMCVDLASGTVLSAYGLASSSLFDIDGMSVGLRDCGDCVVSTSNLGKSFGLVTGAFLSGTVGLTPYTIDGQLGCAASHASLYLGTDDGGFPSSADHVASVLAYPIVGRQDLQTAYGLSPLARQDWFCFVAIGHSLYLVQGQPSNIVGATLVYSADRYITAVFIDPTDYSLMLIEDDGSGTTTTLERIKIGTSLTSAGVTPVFNKSVYAVEIPLMGGMDVLTEQSCRESQYLDGKFVYPNGSFNWVTIDMGSGATISTAVSDTALATDAWLYNSATGSAIVIVDGVPKNVTLSAALGGAINLSDYLTWLCLNAGYAADAISVTGIDDRIEGARIDSAVGLWTYLTELAAVFNFSYFESEGKIKFRRGTSGDASQVAYTIDLSSLALVDGGVSGLNENIITTIAAGSEVAGAVAVTYVDIGFGFQNNSQTFQRSRFPFQDTQIGSLASYDTYIVMTASQCLKYATRLAFSQYAESVVQSVRLPFAYSRLEPSDVINLIIGTEAYLVDVKEIVFNTDWSLSTTCVDFNYRTNITGAIVDVPFGNPQPTITDNSSLPLVIDSTLPDASDDPGPIAALLLTGVESRGQSSWVGATFNLMAGIFPAPWVQLYFNNRQVAYGHCVGTLPKTDVPFQTDDGTLDVISTTMSNIPSITGTDADLWTGTNAAYVGDVGRWELIYYESLTWLNTRRLTISKILRGRRGTELNCNNHTVNDLFIPFDRAVIRPYPIASVDIGGPISVSAVGQGITTPAPVVTTTLTGNSLKPWAPADIHATVYGTDVIITWKRRDRISGSSTFVTTNVPMSEATETYELDIMHGGTVARTVLGLTAPTYTYTAEQLTADGWIQTPFRINVYQMSAVVGRGFVGTLYMDTPRAGWAYNWPKLGVHMCAALSVMAPRPALGVRMHVTLTT